MSSVWCAEDRTLGREVAIKLPAEPLAGDEAAVRRFEREARAAARVSSHSHVATIYDIGQTTDADGRPRAFIVMEYLTGGTVGEALSAGTVTPEKALRWLGEAAAALDYAHAHGVVHRDVKPANLLLDRDSSLHVADFGIAHLSSEETITGPGHMLGTAAYLAPERAAGGKATAASDRYSLAVVAYELLTGSRPFTAEHSAAQARAHLDQEPPSARERNPALPVAIDAVLARGMAKRPQDRWPSAQQLVERLELAMSGTPEPTRPIAVPEPTRPIPVPVSASSSPTRLPPIALNPSARPSRSHRRLAAVLALGAALACAVAIALIAGSGAGTPARHSRHATAHTRGAAKRASAGHSTPAAPGTTEASAPSTTTAPTQTPTPATAAALQARGHSLILAGNYAQAIPVLRQAVANAAHSSVTYAYALFDLGHALRLAGDPAAAVPILRQRLQIPNQTPVVQAELDAALRQLGQSSGGGTPAAAGQPGKPGKGPKPGNGAGD